MGVGGLGGVGGGAARVKAGWSQENGAQTQTLTHTVFAYVKGNVSLSQRRWTGRSAHSRKRSQYDEVNVEVEIGILHILLIRGVGKRTNTLLLPPFLPSSLSLAH